MSSCRRKDRRNHPSESRKVIGAKCGASTNWRGDGARTLCRSGDVGGDQGVCIIVGVRRGRAYGRVCESEELALCCQILIPVEGDKKEEGGAEEELEELMRDTSFKALSELSQHEELQDLELHCGKTV